MNACSEMLALFGLSLGYPVGTVTAPWNRMEYLRHGNSVICMTTHVWALWGACSIISLIEGQAE